jgi:tetratricopeptide (TPR) repeat protein
MRKRLLFLATACVATAVNGAVMVIGSSDAQACYQAAKAERASDAGIALCTTAIDSRELNARDLAATRINRGILHMYGRDTEAALADYDAAIASKTRFGEAYVNRAIALLRIDQGRATEAIEALTTGIELGTNEPEVAHYMRAVAYEILGDAKNAYLDYRQAAAIEPNWQDPKLALRRFQVVKASTG